MGCAHKFLLQLSLLNMAPMKVMKTGGAMTQTGVYQSVAETTGLKTKDVKGVVDAFMGVARAGEEVRLLQACRYAEHEAQEQTGNEGTQGHQPLHQGAVCFQGEACIEDSEVLRDEEAQGDALSQRGVRVLSL